MCGIAGIYKKKGVVDRGELFRLNELIRHRGPDGEGYWIHEDGFLGFSHRRLSIIDLSDNGKQPMHYMDRYTIVFNGEIYNYVELRNQLLQFGYSFRSDSDTEVLLAAYDKFGVGCLDLLNGMFAFALWDNFTQELFMARDRFGEKPLYYSFLNGNFYFASEMKALFGAGVSRTFSPDRVYGYLQHNAFIDRDDEGSTFYTQVRQLNPASWVRIRSSEIIESGRYWNVALSPGSLKMNTEDAVEEFRRLLTDSIRIRLRADVRMGVSISGGIDSSSIAFLLQEAGGLGAVKDSFSARFKNFIKDEGVFIDKVLTSFRDISAHYTWPDADELMEDIHHLAYAQEEPFYSGSIYNQYRVMKLAATSGISVLLEGQGADEQLGGYNHHYSHYLTWLFINDRKRYAEARMGYERILGDIYPYHVPRTLPVQYLFKWLGLSAFTYDESPRELLLRESTCTGLQSLLRYGDRNSMIWGRELRLPFLDHRITEFLFSLPDDMIFRNGWTKYILRRSVEQVVPDDITWRRDKIGFEPPQDLWLKKLDSIIAPFKSKTDYRDFTGGRRVREVVEWKWLMLKLFFSES